MSYPLSFYVAIVLLAGLLVDLWHQRSMPWALPTLLVYVIVAAWYFVDLIAYGEKYNVIPEIFLARSYWQVIAFLIVFRLSLVPFARRVVRRFTTKPQPPMVLGAEKLFYTTCVLWLVLLVFAVGRMDWDFINALFPMEGRNGNLMWLRAAAGDAGPLGFLVSTGGYLYLVTCSFFGILAVLLRPPALKLAATGMVMLSWPFFLMSGTRNSFLAVCMPWIFTFSLFGRQKKAVRFGVIFAAFLALDFAFLVVISHRGTGYKDVLTQGTEFEGRDEATQHEGLNMIQELCFINIYSYVDQMQPTMGMDYLSNLLNFVPRAIWPSKPMAGTDYAKWRGFEGGDSDIGVVATVSSGLIGQGVLEFGPLFGPLAPAIMMALWCALLTLWWMQRASVLRLCLFMLGVGVTFNLGRNISALVLWPVAFAYILILATEKLLVKGNTPAFVIRKQVALPSSIPRVRL